MSTPGRPRIQPAARVNPEIVDGTTLHRAYETPDLDDRISPGDIVVYEGRQWTVAGWDTMKPRETDGYLPITLHLERVKREEGKRTQVTRERADSRRCRLVGRQVLLPGLPEPPPPEVQEGGGGAQRG